MSSYSTPDKYSETAKESPSSLVLSSCSSSSSSASSSARRTKTDKQTPIKKTTKYSAKLTSQWHQRSSNNKSTTIGPVRKGHHIVDVIPTYNNRLSHVYTDTIRVIRTITECLHN